MSFSDFFPNQNGPRSGTTKYGMFNGSKHMVYRISEIFFEKKSKIKKKDAYAACAPYAG